MKRLLGIFALFFVLSGQAQQYYLLIGTYTTGNSKGIYTYRFDAATGKLSSVSEVDTNNPSFLTFSPDGRFVYSVNENPGPHDGGVSAFSYNAQTGGLRALNMQSSLGESPCYVSEDSTGKWVMVANYNGGNLSAYPVGADGTLGESKQLVQHQGVGSNPQRQEKAHVHTVFFTPDQRYLLTPDLGLDKVYVYDFHPGEDSPLSPAAVPYLNFKPGSGPRHIDFSPDHRFMYVLTELSGEVNVFGYAKGKFTPIQRVPSVIADTSADKGSADIHVSADGKFLYTSDRGVTNDIAVFEVHTGSGKLKRIGSISSDGAKPRNFTIDPTGHFLLVANQDGNDIVVFKRNTETGLLTPTGEKIQMDHPVCLKWGPHTN